MRHATATGRRRHVARRTFFWGREYLVLQVEERGLLTTFIGGHQDTQWVRRWRDATSGDLTIHDSTCPAARGEAPKNLPTTPTEKAEAVGGKFDQEAAA